MPALTTTVFRPRAEPHARWTVDADGFPVLRDPLRRARTHPSHWGRDSRGRTWSDDEGTSASHALWRADDPEQAIALVFHPRWTMADALDCTTHTLRAMPGLHDTQLPLCVARLTGHAPPTIVYPSVVDQRTLRIVLALPHAPDGVDLQAIADTIESHAMAAGFLDIHWCFVACGTGWDFSSIVIGIDPARPVHAFECRALSRDDALACAASLDPLHGRARIGAIIARGYAEIAFTPLGVRRAVVHPEAALDDLLDELDPSGVRHRLQDPVWRARRDPTQQAHALHAVPHRLLAAPDLREQLGCTTIVAAMRRAIDDHRAPLAWTDRAPLEHDHRVGPPEDLVRALDAWLGDTSVSCISRTVAWRVAMAWGVNGTLSRHAVRDLHGTTLPPETRLAALTYLRRTPSTAPITWVRAARLLPETPELIDEVVDAIVWDHLQSVRALVRAFPPRHAYHPNAQQALESLRGWSVTRRDWSFRDQAALRDVWTAVQWLIDAPPSTRRWRGLREFRDGMIDIVRANCFYPAQRRRIRRLWGRPLAELFARMRGSGAPRSPARDTSLGGVRLRLYLDEIAPAERSGEPVVQRSARLARSGAAAAATMRDVAERELRARPHEAVGSVALAICCGMAHVHRAWAVDLFFALRAHVSLWELAYHAVCAPASDAPRATFDTAQLLELARLCQVMDRLPLHARMRLLTDCAGQLERAPASAELAEALAQLVRWYPTNWALRRAAYRCAAGMGAGRNAKADPRDTHGAA